MSILSSKLSKSDIHLLSVFITVVESRGFTAAQIPLNVSNSTISRQISDLEVRLGLRLCQRGRSGFALTERGKLVYNAALDLFKAIEVFESDIDILHDKPTGTLSLAVIENWTSEKQPQLVEALRVFRDVAPDVYIEIYALPPDQIERGILDGSISIGIGVFHNHKPLWFISLSLARRWDFIVANTIPYFTPKTRMRLKDSFTKPITQNENIYPRTH